MKPIIKTKIMKARLLIFTKENYQKAKQILRDMVSFDKKEDFGERLLIFERRQAIIRFIKEYQLITNKLLKKKPDKLN